VTADSFNPTTLIKEGPQDITVSYQGKTDTYTVTVTEAVNPPLLEITNYTMEGERIAVGLTAYDYIIRVHVTNSGSSAKNVTVALNETQSQPNVLVLIGKLDFGDIAEGETKSDTIRLRIANGAAFNSWQLDFTQFSWE